MKQSGFSRKCVPILLTHCILVDSSTVICCTSPCLNLRVSGLFCSFYLFLMGKSC